MILRSTGNGCGQTVHAFTKIIVSAYRIETSGGSTFNEPRSVITGIILKNVLTVSQGFIPIA